MCLRLGCFHSRAVGRSGTHPESGTEGGLWRRSGGPQVALGRRMFSQKLPSDRWQRDCCHITFPPASESVAVQDKSVVK